MAPWRDRLSRLARRWGLLAGVHQLQFRWAQWRHAAANRGFQRAHPELSLPPDYLMYESYRLDYQRYYEQGRVSAAWILDLLRQQELAGSGRILEWGCGPGRLIRHLPALLGPSYQVFGVDTNRDSIDWCQAHLSDSIQFAPNAHLPPLDFPADHFVGIYAISIFTHLDAVQHEQWLHELLRVLQPGGLLLFTTHGAGFAHRLSAPEKARFQAGELVVWDKMPRGHRNFAAFQPAAFVRQWVAPHPIKLHQAGERGVQDTWIIQKGGR